MLCTKSHVYVAKVTRKHVFVVKCCWILTLVRHHASVHFSEVWHRLVQVIPGVQFAQHRHIWIHSQYPPGYAYYSVLKA